MKRSVRAVRSRLGLMALVLLSPSAFYRSASNAWSRVAEWQSITEQPAPCKGCLKITASIVLGDTSGPGELQETKDVVRDRQGRFWVGQQGHLKVFGPDGRYLRTVGRSGQGPLEFNWARPLFLDSLGRVAVFDRDNRVTLIRPTFDLDSTYYSPTYIRAAIPLPSGDYVAAAWAPSAEAIGQPLHVLRASRIIRSFGVLAEETGEPQGQMGSERVLSSFPDGRFVASHTYDYAIGIWDRDATNQVAALKGPVLNPGMIRGAFSRENPIPHQITAVRPLNNSHLMVGMARRRADWLDHVIDGGRGMTVKPGSGWENILSGRIDVIDLASRRIVGRLETSDIVVRFLDHEHAVLQRHTEVGVAQLVIATVSFRSPEDTVHRRVLGATEDGCGGTSLQRVTFLSSAKARVVDRMNLQSLEGFFVRERLGLTTTKIPPARVASKGL